jgi:hypothetical protein
MDSQVVIAAAGLNEDRWRTFGPLRIDRIREAGRAGARRADRVATKHGA